MGMTGECGIRGVVADMCSYTRKIDVGIPPIVRPQAAQLFSLAMR